MRSRRTGAQARPPARVRPRTPLWRLPPRSARCRRSPRLQCRRAGGSGSARPGGLGREGGPRSGAGARPPIVLRTTGRKRAAVRRLPPRSPSPCRTRQPGRPRDRPCSRRRLERAGAPAQAPFASSTIRAGLGAPGRGSSRSRWGRPPSRRRPNRRVMSCGPRGRPPPRRSAQQATGPPSPRGPSEGVACPRAARRSPRAGESEPHPA